MQYQILDEDSDQYKQEVRRLQTLRTQVVLWLVVLAMGVALIPLMLIANWVRSDVTRLEADLLSVQGAMSQATNPTEEIVKINGEIAEVKNLLTLMQTVTVPSGLNWPVIVNAVVQYDPTTIQINSFTQSVDRIQIAGNAVSNDAVVGYQQNLLNSAVFRDVVVISISAIPPTPVPAAPASNGNKAKAAPTPTTAPIFGKVEFVIDLVTGAPTP